MIEEIISYTIDIDAIGFQCFANISCGDGMNSISAFCAMGNDNQIIVASGSTLSIWNIETMKRMGVLIGHRKTVICCCPLSKDKVVSGSSDHDLRIWDIRTQQCIAVLRGHQDYVESCCIMGNGNIVSASEDNTLKL